MVTDDDEMTVSRDADPGCNICEGAGWHWGWHITYSGHRQRRIEPGAPVRLRCPCVDRIRAEQRRA
ncbi:MAG: hypothetical protein QOD40_565 [Alphaproteobacteria bacterium]|jgi:hypothetical protein|nr:hypothetical protein [Alphaproteobacteria bacterium]